MVRLAYDGTLDGFFTCLGVLFPDCGPKGPPAGCARIDSAVLPPRRSREPDLFEETRAVASDRFLADGFRARAARAWGREALRSLEYGFRSGSEDREALLLGFVSALAEGRGVKDVADPRVLEFRTSLRRISHEVGKLEGFVRFREIEGGGLYAEIEPDNDVVDLLAPHFRRRHPRDPWLIRDLRRGKAVFWDLVEVRLAEAPEDGREMLEPSGPRPDGNEKAVTELWKLYFRAIEIRERRNPELQAKLVPRRYRKHLPEFDDAGSR